MHKRKKRQLKLGNLYIIEYNDHFSSERAMSTDESNFRPVVLRTVGRLVAITPTHYNLEHSRRIDGDDEAYSHSIRGIMTPCVVSITDLGPWPQKRKN